MEYDTASCGFLTSKLRFGSVLPRKAVASAEETRKDMVLQWRKFARGKGCWDQICWKQSMDIPGMIENFHDFSRFFQFSKLNYCPALFVSVCTTGFFHKQSGAAVDFPRKAGVAKGGVQQLCEAARLAKGKKPQLLSISHDEEILGSNLSKQRLVIWW